MKWYKTRPGEKWKYIFREIAIVITGILIAFSLNSWWQNLRDEKARDLIRDNLSMEIEFNEIELARTLAIHQKVLDCSNYLLLKLKESSGPVVVADTLIFGMVICATFDPAEGAINSILSSGKLDLIDNIDLIRSLTTWNRMRSDQVEDEQAAFLFVENRMFPFLQKKIDYTRIATGTWQIIDNKVVFKSPFPEQEVPNDLEFQNLLSERITRLKVAIGALKKINIHQVKMKEILETN